MPVKRVDRKAELRLRLVLARNGSNGYSGKLSTGLRMKPKFARPAGRPNGGRP